MKKIILLTLLILSERIAISQQLPIFKVKGEEMIGLNDSETKKMQQALSIFEKVMNDPGFQKALSDYQFAFDVADDPNRNLTTEQIVEKLYNGAEWYYPNVDYTANVFWKLIKKPWYKPKDAIGYGMPTDTVIFTYTWFFDEDDNLADIVGHIAHEWSHKAGFEHAFEPHDGREKTVPYAFGNIVATFAANYIPHGPEMLVRKLFSVPCNNQTIADTKRTHP